MSSVTLMVKPGSPVLSYVFMLGTMGSSTQRRRQTLSAWALTRRRYSLSGSLPENCVLQRWKKVMSMIISRHTSSAWGRPAYTRYRQR